MYSSNQKTSCRSAKGADNKLFRKEPAVIFDQINSHANNPSVKLNII